MKNKKTAYLLAVCVGIVWSVIFYKVYAQNSEDEVKVSVAADIQKDDLFDLIDHRSDPFVFASSAQDSFGQNIVNSVEKFGESSVPYSADKPVINRPLKPSVNWEVIKYKGFIINSLTHDRVAIVIVNNKEALLTEKEHFLGLTLLKNCGDSIKVIYQQEIGYIKIK